MYINSARRVFSFELRFCFCFLAVAWVFGVLLGAYVSRSSEPFPVRVDVLGSVSFFSLLTATLLPFLFTSVSICFSKPNLITVLAFYEAFLLAYCSQLFHSAYGSAWWFISCLVLFSDCMTAPLIWFLWLRFLRPIDRRTCYTVVTINTLLAVVIVYFDYRYIVPLVLEIT
jgi:hypothetical protein